MEASCFTIVLDREAHHWAKKFAAQQTSLAKGRSVYLNTLAVCAVQQYLKFVCQLQLEPGDAWRPSYQSIMDVADLVIPQLGKIECRSILPGETIMIVPPESIDDRVGYVAVQFNETLDQVELLGFTQHLSAGEILIDQLSPLENLIDLVMTALPSAVTTNLGEILAGILQNGWESIGSLVTDEMHLDKQEIALRNIATTLNHTPYDSIQVFTAGKMIDLKIHLGNIALLLLIGLNKEPDGRMKVRVRLYSAGQEMQLPPNLRLTLQDGNGQVTGQVQYAQPMNFIQLNYFRLESGTKFNIQVALADRSLTESFIA
jgi:Protein of unknown function (DUF1822)